MTSNDQNVWSFQLNGNRKIYMPHLAAFNEKAFLPKIGSDVTIYHAHYELIPPYFVDQKPESYYLCDKTKFDSSSSNIVNKKSCILLKLIKEHNLSIDNFKNLIKSINSEFALVFKENREDSTFLVYEILAELKRINFDCVKFKTISQCKFINTNINSDVKGPYFSFGCHPSRENEILLGFFTLFKQYGLFFLKDTEGMMLCVVKRENDENLKHYVEKFVCITKFVVFTETIRDHCYGIDYLFFNINDVFVVNFDRTKKIVKAKYLREEKCLLLKKSMVNDFVVIRKKEKHYMKHFCFSQY